MKEERGNIWHKHTAGHWIVVPTNNYVKLNGECVMGRGLALQAKTKFPALAYELGQRIKGHGEGIHFFEDYRLIAFPVKHRWFEMADLDLIADSTDALKLGLPHTIKECYLPRVGCGNGGLRWLEVRPILLHLDDRFTVVDYNG